MHYATANGSATAGSDYTAISGSLAFSPGQTSKTVNVTVAGDITLEPNETFSMNLGGTTTGAKVFDGQGIGTILNDEGPRLQINNASLAEGNSGNRALTFTVTLSPASAGPVTVSYATADGTAIAGSDYTAVPLTPLTFSAGQTSKTVSINMIGNARGADETFVESERGYGWRVDL
jgi:hypothetical protein